MAGSGCALPQGTTQASSSNSPGSTAATASPSTATSQTASATASSAIALSCRLPILITTGQVQQPGFLNFPGGGFTADPGGSKAGGVAYDRVYNRWLPVEWRLVSDDGTRYAYATLVGDPTEDGSYSVIHVVNVATGVDRAVNQSGRYIPVDFVGNSVYLKPWVGGIDGPGPQIGWALDPSTGSVRSLNGGTKYGYWIGGGAGWRMDYTDIDPTVLQGMPGTNRITRIDLTTGVEATWYYQQGATFVQVAGFDRFGHPIVSASAGAGGEGGQVLLLMDARHRVTLYSGPLMFHFAVADANGIWLSDGSSTYLYASGSLHKVAATGGTIAGGCH
jgi:hypothetical protein